MNSDSKRLDFGQHIDVQAKLQSVVAVAHSNRTFAFANVMNFCDFRRFLDRDDDSYAFELRSFVQDDEDLAKVDDGFLFFGRIERKFGSDEKKILVDENRKTSQTKQRSAENSIEQIIDEDWDLAQLWECGLNASQTFVPVQPQTPLKAPQTPLKQVPQTKTPTQNSKPQIPTFKSEVKAIFNGSPRLKIPMQRKASLNRKTSRIGPLDFFVKREPEPNVKSRTTNAADPDPSSIAATCSNSVPWNPATIFDDDDDELLAKCDFDVRNHSAIAANSIKTKSRQDSPRIEPKTEAPMACTESQQSAWPSTLQSNCNLNFDLGLMSNCNLNFDLDLIDAEENVKKPSFPTSGDDTDVDVIPPTPKRPKMRLCLRKQDSNSANPRPESTTTASQTRKDLAATLNNDPPAPCAGNAGDDEQLYRINPFLLGTIQYQARDTIPKSSNAFCADCADSNDFWDIETPAKSLAKPIETSTPAIGLRGRVSSRPGPSKRLIVSSDDDSPVFASKNRKKPKRIVSDDEDDEIFVVAENVLPPSSPAVSDSEPPPSPPELDADADGADRPIPQRRRVIIIVAKKHAQGTTFYIIRRMLREKLAQQEPVYMIGATGVVSPSMRGTNRIFRRKYDTCCAGQKFQNEMIEFEASESSFADSQQQIRLPRSRDDTDISTDDEAGWLPDSFVDWNSQPEYNASQSRKDESDMYAVYAESVKDRVGPSAGRYKLAYGLNANVDVFSQAPGPEYQQSYEMDTFCVPNDFVEFASGDDESGAEGSTSTGKQRRKRRRRKSNQLGKRRRLVDETDSD